MFAIKRQDGSFFVDENHRVYLFDTVEDAKIAGYLWYGRFPDVKWRVVEMETTT